MSKRSRTRAGNRNTTAEAWRRRRWVIQRERERRERLRGFRLVFIWKRALEVFSSGARAPQLYNMPNPWAMPSDPTPNQLRWWKNRAVSVPGCTGLAFPDKAKVQHDRTVRVFVLGPRGTRARPKVVERVRIVLSEVCPRDIRLQVTDGRKLVKTAQRLELDRKLWGIWTR